MFRKDVGSQSYKVQPNDTLNAKGKDLTFYILLSHGIMILERKFGAK
jgi:hypothetical protein